MTQLFDFKFFEQYVYVLCILLHNAVSIFKKMPQQGKNECLYVDKEKINSPVKKMDKKHERPFKDKKTQMTCKHMKRCQTP